MTGKKVIYYNPRQEVIHRDKTIVNLDSHPGIKAGQTRVHGVINTLARTSKENYAGYRLKVIRIR